MFRLTVARRPELALALTLRFILYLVLGSWVSSNYPLRILTAKAIRRWLLGRSTSTGYGLFDGGGWHALASTQDQALCASPTPRESLAPTAEPPETRPRAGKTVGPHSLVTAVRGGAEIDDPLNELSIAPKAFMLVLAAEPGRSALPQRSAPVGKWGLWLRGEGNVEQRSTRHTQPESS